MNETDGRAERMKFAEEPVKKQNVETKSAGDSMRNQAMRGGSEAPKSAQHQKY